MGMIDFSLGDVGSVFKDIREAITGESIKDPTKLAELNFKMNQLEQLARDGQIAINKEEAKSTNIFVAGWRPFIGWVGGVSLAYSFIVQPLIVWYAGFHHIVVQTPTLDTGTLMNLVLAMLGFGGLRTFEKLKGIDTKQISNIEPAKEEKY